MAELTLDTIVEDEHQGFTVDSFVKTVEEHSAMGALRYPIPVVRRIGEVINAVASFFEISPRMLASQILHETGFFRFFGDVNWWQFNFAGLGATGGVIGYILTVFKDRHAFQLEPTFSAVKSRSIVVDWDDIDIGESIWHAVTAVAVHHYVYLHGTPEKWDLKYRRYASNDPRLTAVIAAKSLHTKTGGLLTSVQSYGGNWAVPGLKYGDMIVHIASLLQEEYPASGVEPMKTCPIPFEVNHIPWANSNRTRETSLASGRGWITIHETGNPRDGADARMHQLFSKGRDGWGGGGHPAGWHNGKWRDEYEGVSFTYTIDDTRAIELVPRGEKTWQASDGANGPGNSSVSIEVCINRDGNWSETLEKLAQFVVWLTEVDPNLSLDRITQHNRWARDQKNCPTQLRANGGMQWNYLMDRIRSIASPDPTPSPPPVPDVRVIDGFWIIDEMDWKWDQMGDDLALSVLGKPISGMFIAPVDGTERKCQLFERGCLAVYAPESSHGSPAGTQMHVRNLFPAERRKVIQYGKQIGLVAKEMR